MAITMSIAVAADFFPGRILELSMRRVGFLRSRQQVSVTTVALSRTRKAVTKRQLGCLAEFTENGETSSFTDDQKVAKLDLNLPRRSLQAEFTCNACQTRTKRLINPHAYKRGTVYVQCSGCEVYHQLVDNLGLVVEFKYMEENIDPQQPC